MIEYYNIRIIDAESIEEPVTVDEAKDWMRVDYEDDNDLIESMIKSARQTLEKFLNLALVDKTVSFDAKTTCEEDSIRLPYVEDIEEITITDVDKDEEVVADNYKLRYSGVKVNYSGLFGIEYDIEAGEIPEAIKEAIKMEVAERYANRGENDKTEGLSKSALSKASSYQQVWI